VSRDTYAPMPSRRRDGDALVAREGLRAFAVGAKVEWKRGQAVTRPRATNVRVI
jgi:hypothetical protein